VEDGTLEQPTTWTSNDFPGSANQNFLRIFAHHEHTSSAFESKNSQHQIGIQDHTKSETACNQDPSILPDNANMSGPDLSMRPVAGSARGFSD
jgi:hypothetical protein